MENKEALYQQTVEWLLAQLPMYQRKGATAYKPGLDNMLALADYLGQPHKKFPSIHIAGTNGKGSTAHLMAAALQQAGYRVGLYTSPHLVDFRERIKINGHYIAKDFITQWVGKNRDFLAAHGFSFFEMTVGLAFEYFAVQEVDVAVVEVGLGGRLDATNILHPVLSVITNIGLDHVHILGDTLPQIAREKAGIIKDQVPVVVGQTQNEVQGLFRRIAEQKNAPISFADQCPQHELSTDLQGPYQFHNVQTAAIALEQLPGFRVGSTAMQKAFAKTKKLTGLLGRWQQIGEQPTCIADVSHNQEGLALAVKGFESYSYRQLHLVLGFVQEKDIAALLALFPTTAEFYFCAPNISRAFHLQDLQKIVPPSLSSRYFRSVEEAFNAAQSGAQKEDLIYVGGSTFVVAEILR